MKKSLTALLGIAGLLLYISPAFAAIGFDVSAGTQNVNLTTVNTAITVTSSQSNQILVVGIYGEKATALSVNSVKYGGINLTQYASTTNNTGGSSTISLWYLVAPAQGAGNVTTTFSTLASVFEICASSFYNVNQSTPFESGFASTTGTGHSNISSSITTVLSNDWTVDMVGDNAAAGVNLGLGTGQTLGCNQNTGGEHGGSSWKAVPTAQTTSTFWTNGSSTWGGVAVAMEAFAQGSPAPQMQFTWSDDE